MDKRTAAKVRKARAEAVAAYNRERFYGMASCIRNGSGLRGVTAQPSYGKLK